MAVLTVAQLEVEMVESMAALKAEPMVEMSGGVMAAKMVFRQAVLKVE